VFQVIKSTKYSIEKLKPKGYQEKTEYECCR